jgi:molybdate transport system substrate-binding protein
MAHDAMRAIMGTILLLAAGTAPARAADIKVMSAGAVEAALQPLAAAFEHERGKTIELDFGTVGAIEDRLKKGESADVVILSALSIDTMDRAAKLVSESRIAVGRVGIGVAVRDGAERPDIATPDRFKSALLAAPSIVYADPGKGASSGIYLASLFDRLGIAGEIKSKALLEPGGYVVERVASGDAALGIHNISEILPVKGVTLVGPLPAELQNYTSYAGAVPRTAAARETARDFLAYITSADVASRWQAAGVEPAQEPR